MGQLSEALDKFMVDNRSAWTKKQAQDYLSILRPFCKAFDAINVIPGEKRIVSWIEILGNVFTEQPLTLSTKNDYYKRIRALYRHSGFQDLPYHRFSRRQGSAHIKDLTPAKAADTPAQ